MPITFESCLSRVALIGGRDCGANWDAAAPDYDCPPANAKTLARASEATKVSADVNEIERLINEIERRNCWWWIRCAAFLSLARLTGS
jgi:hypothetical protein